MVAKSRTAETYDILQRDLLNGIYAPGSRLRIDLIGEALEVSPGAVREALARLTSDGLVVGITGGITGNYGDMILIARIRKTARFRDGTRIGAMRIMSP